MTSAIYPIPQAKYSGTFSSRLKQRGIKGLVFTDFRHILLLLHRAAAVRSNAAPTRLDIVTAYPLFVYVTNVTFLNTQI